jgi:hypothetical protein
VSVAPSAASGGKIHHPLGTRFWQNGREAGGSNAMLRYFKDDATNASRGLQVYLILIGVAARRETMTYEMLGQKMYHHPAAGVLAGRLDPVMRWCKANDLPALTSIVVNKSTGVPGEGLTTVQGEFPAEHQRVFEYGWHEIMPPSVEELQALLNHQ